MTILFILLSIVAFAFFAPKTAVFFKVLLELLILVFYAVALIIIAVICIRTYEDKEQSSVMRSQEIDKRD